MKPLWLILDIRALPQIIILVALCLLPTRQAESQIDVNNQLSESIARIIAVRYHVEPGQTRIWFETVGPVLYTHYSPDPLSLVIDLPGVDISSLGERTIVRSSEVEAILATSLEGINGKLLSRIEIKLATIVPYQLSGSERALNVRFDVSDGPGTESTSPETMLLQEEPTLSVPVADADVANASSELTESMPGMLQEEPVLLTREPVRAQAPAYYGSLPASTISAVTHNRVGEHLEVTVHADGRLNYTTFFLESPSRLVFDFNGVSLNGVPRAALSVKEMGIARIRFSQFRNADPRITRLVFDLDDVEISHRAVEGDTGLRISFGRLEGERRVPTTARDNSGLNISGTSEQVESERASELSTMVINSESMVEALTQPVSYVPEASVESVGLGFSERSLLEANPVEPSLPTPPAEPAPTPQPERGQTLSNGPVLGQKVYTGELVSLDFKDGDIQDIFRLFADISGLNIVVQPGVQGRITLKLTEVPWDQALELILKTNKLGYIAEGNVIRIASLSELAEEESERRRLAEEQALAGDLITQTRVLSYAKATELEDLLKRTLSARGDIVIDERTNTVIYTDLVQQIQAINSLINTLDTAIPGVEIESRIVVTTRTFSRQLGVQWGFTSNQLQNLGNTTELVFPNRVQIGGQPIGSESDVEFRTPGVDTGGVQPPGTREGAAILDRGYAVNLPFAGAPTGAIGLSLGSITGAFSIDAALSAAERRGQVRIISAPKIITQNNRPAEIKQGVTFPVQVVANNTITVQFKDAVLELQVTPQITSADTIILDIVVNNDALDFGQAVNGIPSIVTQSATTQVLVADGSTTVIGGVFVNRQETQERYVPLLHRIPVLGHLFQSNDNTSRNEELLIFLTPRIRKDPV